MRTALALLLTGFLLGPGAWAKPKDKSDLKLTASVDTSAPDQEPALVVEIINQSGHALRIPDPPLLCKPAPGALSLLVKFIPEDPRQPQKPRDCELEVDGSGLPDILERSKNWLVLKQGQTYEARRPLSMGVDTNARGTYDLWVIYDGPCANETELQKLKDAQIDVPKGRFQSERLTYKIGLQK
jgi:hypothetical protein